MAPRSRFDSLRTAEDQGTVGRARDARGDGDAIMGLSNTVAAVAVAAASRGAVSAAEPGAVTFAAEDGVAILVIFDYPRRRMILARPTD
jgi:hypothetical protein